jgi:predicted membrane protein
MGIAIFIILLLVVIAAIGVAFFYMAMLVLLGTFAISSLCAYALLFAVLGDDHTGIALILAILIGVGATAIIVKDFKG